MKLLLDANLSPRLIGSISDLFPDSGHAFGLGLGPDDEAIRNFAKDNEFTDLTKDSDFYRFSVMRGAPPKVAWLRVGNDGTDEIARMLRLRASELLAFGSSATEALLVLGKQ